MTTRAYGISAVHYSDDDSPHIEYVRVHEIKRPAFIADADVKKPRRLTVDEVIDKIENGEEFMTLLRRNDTWVRGRQVGKVALETCIRSHPTRTKPEFRDDLKDLPHIK